MEIRFNVTGPERKALVTAVSQLTGRKAVYKGAPGFAFEVSGCVIDRYGTLAFDGLMGAEDIRSLLAGLVGRGFALEDSVGDFSGGGTPAADDFAKGDSSEDAPGTLSIEIPLPGFTDADFGKLEKLVAGKAALIRKSIGTDSLVIERTGDRLRFPWFPAGASPDEVTAYTQLAALLCEAAKAQKRVTAKEKPVENEKYAMRCFLLKLGFIGKEYASARRILLANLSGDGSFKSGRRKDRDEGAPVAAYVAALEAAVAVSVGSERPNQPGDCLSCSNSMSEEALLEDGADRLFCLVKQEYVEEDDCCGEFN